jgi:hypothetical protein
MKLIELNSLAIRQDKLLAVMMADTMGHPCIKFFLEGTENVIVIPCEDIPTRNKCYEKIIEQFRNG